MPILKWTGDQVPERLYVIGDIHGRADLLDRMLESIANDVARHPARSAIVTVGDYVDRGPDSRGVLERLIDPGLGIPLHALYGNHEQMLQGFLENPRANQSWLRQGGLDTLASYGVPINQAMVGKGISAAAETLEWLMPPHHRRFIEAMPTAIMLPGVFICHAGVRPGCPLDEQVDEDLLWIRGEFLNSDADLGSLIVHGHTITPEIERKPNRIGIDIGAYRSGRLACLIIEGQDTYALIAEQK